MIGTSRAEYVFIRLCIFGLHYLAPLCVLYSIFLLAVYGLKATLYRLPLALEIFAVVETLFYLVVYLPCRYHLQSDAVHPPPPSREERKELFYLCHYNVSNPEAYFQKWFEGADIKEIKRDNVKEFFLWAFFNRGGPPGDDDEELDEYILAAEKLLGRPLEPGRGKAKALRLTLDRVGMLHRSLTWYSCVGFVDFMTFIKLRYNGFRFHRTPISQFFRLFPLRPQALLTTYRSPAKYTSYWYRPHTSATKLPVVFIHGIGIGLYPYTSFLAELNSAGGKNDPNDQIGVIAIEIMPVAFRLTHHALAREELCAEISAIIYKHFPGQKFVLTSHSYGTVISAHLLQSPLASQIGPVFLIDPVCILLHLPDVAFNFSRRQPKRANEHQLHYFASMDMGVAHTLGRCFFWNENIIWKKDVAARKVTISLGGRDLIVNSEAVGRYWSAPVGGYEKTLLDRDVTNNQVGDGILIDIDETQGAEDFWTRRGTVGISLEDEQEWKHRDWKGSGTEVVWFDDLDHAQVFDKASTRLNLVQKIWKYCEDG